MLAVLGRFATLHVLVLGIGLLASTRASAQIPRTWVSGVGDDAASCVRTQPCKTFAGAYAKTVAGGEINCLDRADFGPISIDKSLTIECGTTGGFIQVSSGRGIFVSAPNASVAVNGLDIQSVTPDAYSGITVIDAASVVVRNSSIRGFRFAWGMEFTPYNGLSQLHLDNVTIADNGLRTSSGIWSGGLYLTPAGGSNHTIGALRVTIHNSRFIGNYNAGIRVVLPGGSDAGSVQAVVTDSDLTGTRNGQGLVVYAMPGNSTGKIMLTNTRVTGNSTGISVDTPDSNQVGMSVGNSSITRNGRGLQLLNAAQVRSFGDNRLDGNANGGALSGIANDGAFTAPIIPKR